MHLRDEAGRLLVHTIVREFRLREEERAGVVAIAVHRKGGQRQEVDAIAILQDVKIVVAQTVAKDVGNAGKLSGGCTHPDNIMVSPGKVHIMVPAKVLHDQMRAVAPVIDVAEDMQLIDNHALRQPGKCDNKGVSLLNINNGIQNLLIIALFVIGVIFGVDQFADNVSEIVGQGFLHLGTSVFGGCQTADLHHTAEGIMVPLTGVQALGPDVLQLAFRIINQRGKHIFLLIRKGVSEGLLNFPPDRSRSVAQNMRKGFVFAVNITDEMLRSFGEVEDGTQIDNLGAGRLDIGIGLRKKVQIFDAAG